MDTHDLFRKLGVGAKFNLKRFQNDAERLKIIRPSLQTSAHADTNTRHVVDFFGSEKRERKAKQGKIQEPVLSLKKRKLQGETLSDEDSDESEEEKGNDDDDDDEDDEDEDEDDDDDDTSDDEGKEGKTDEDGELQLLGSLKSRGMDEGMVTKKKKKRISKERLAVIKQETINHFRNKNRIHVYGTDIPDPGESFEQMAEGRLHPQVLANLKLAGFDTPTPIQMQALPAMINRREILACAPTGSGKTAAFIIPVLHHLKEPRRQGFRALVLAPTRELAQQTYREFNRLADGLHFRIFLIENANTAAKKFGPKSSQKFDILVTTPNRLVFMLNQDPPAINLSKVEWLIVDESDKLFEEGKTGFRDQLAKIYKACDSKHVRRAMFSATFAYEVEEWCKLNLDNVLQVYIGAKNSATDTIKQELIFVGSESGKLIALRDLVRKGLVPPVLIFVQSKDRAKELFHELVYDGINVDVIHSDRTQKQRDNIVKCLRSGQIWVLVCTELMGRGIDFKGVNLVVNYDFPNSAISYIHRIGRTGRAGREGRAITFFTESDVVYLRSIANVMREAGCPVPEYMLQIKKPAKKTRKKLSKRGVKRDSIRTMPQKDFRSGKKHRKISKEHKQESVTESQETLNVNNKRSVTEKSQKKRHKNKEKILKKMRVENQLSNKQE